MHMTARLGCKGAVVGTGRANSYLNGHRKCYSHLVRGLFVLGKAIFVLNVC